ncbi:hypothetical protein C8J57DRAFT_1042258 [Mycena rebaudengoi]|nr:hypothetical protein C8J57DRAFT_1042258 [Mycena rebaudengoi]
MLSITLLTTLLSASLTLAAPINLRALDAAATAEAQVRDDTATRAVSDTQIKTADGQCFSVDKEAGDFRANLIPVTVGACDGSAGQKFDVITAGKHNDQPGTALFVSTLTQGCLNFDERRAPGNQLVLFSCGGRADGGGAVTNSQLFTFKDASAPLALAPINAVGTCVFNNNGKLDAQACNNSAGQLFTIGASGAGGATAAPPAPPAQAPAPPAEAPAPPAEAPAPPAEAPAPPAQAPPAPPAQAPAPPANTPSKLDAAATAEAQVRDDTATRAVSDGQIKTADGQCFTVDKEGGDFRANLIPVTVAACDGSAGQKFDVITAGKHNDQPGTALFVSTLTQGCLNFDERRAPGNQLVLFSCGGRADGGGAVTNSQLFTFKDASAPLTLAPINAVGTCVFNNNGKLDAQACNNSAGQVRSSLFSLFCRRLSWVCK